MPLATPHHGAATPLHASQMRWLFVGEALCYEKLDASPCVHSVIPHAGSPFPCFPCDPWTPKSPSNQWCKITIAFLRLKKAYFENGS